MYSHSQHSQQGGFCKRNDRQTCKTHLQFENTFAHHVLSCLVFFLKPLWRALNLNVTVSVNVFPSFWTYFFFQQGSSQLQRVISLCTL